jgi:[CysO sulfur-carrier protein]-S-L-cysteine hydrolase
VSSSGHLLLPLQIYTDMLAHAQSEYPNECCGLLAGTRDQGVLRVVKRHALINEAASPIEYYAADSLLRANKAMRLDGNVELATYHSHPKSAPIPSATDLERSEFYTHVVHFIISLQGLEPLMRGWWLSATHFEEADWQIVAVG